MVPNKLPLSRPAVVVRVECADDRSAADLLAYLETFAPFVKARRGVVEVALSISAGAHQSSIDKLATGPPRR